MFTNSPSHQVTNSPIELKDYPALDVRCDSSDVLLAIVDDFGPTAVEEHDASVLRAAEEPLSVERAT